MTDQGAILKRHDDQIKDLHSALAKILTILEANGLNSSGPISGSNLTASGNVTAGGNVAGNTLQSTGNGGQKFTLTIGSDANGPYINIDGPY